MVTHLMGADLNNIVKTQRLSDDHVQFLVYQILRGLKACIPHTTHTHTHPCNGPFSRTTRVSRYQKGKTNLLFAEARDSERQWHQLGHMQVCT